MALAVRSGKLDRGGLADCSPVPAALRGYQVRSTSFALANKIFVVARRTPPPGAGSLPLATQSFPPDRNYILTGLRNASNVDDRTSDLLESH